MTKEQLDYYIIPSQNAHGVADLNDSRLEYISGYAGSLSLAVVSKIAAYLFVDRKELLVAQEKVQRGHWFVIPVDVDKSPDFWVSWLATRTEKATVGIDPRLIWDDTAVMLRSLLAIKQSQLKTPTQNLIDKIWAEKSGRSSGASFPDLPTSLHPSRRIGQVQDWIKKQPPSTIVNTDGRMSTERPSGTVLVSPEDISFLMHLEGACHFQAYLYIGLSQCFLFMGESDESVDERVSKFLEAIKIKIRPYKDFYTFLRRREWGAGKILISSRTTHATVLFLTKGDTRCYTLAPSLIDHIKSVEHSVEESVLLWLKYHDSLFKESPLDAHSVGEIIAQDATSLLFRNEEQSPANTTLVELDDNDPSAWTSVRTKLLTWLQHIVESHDACHQVCRLTGQLADNFAEALLKVVVWINTTSHFHRKFPWLTPEDASERLPPSLFLGKNTVVDDGRTDPVGGGGFADIFKGTYEGKPVAMKRFRRFLPLAIDRKTQASRRMFLQEALVWRQLDHRFILPMWGIWSERPETVPYMILPWMKRGNAMDYTQARISRQEVDRLLLEITEGLIYLHGEDIIHGDLCGRNILIDDEYHVQLCDFGLVSLFADPTSKLYLPNSRRAGGTMAWMAPELFRSTPTVGSNLPTDVASPSKPTDIYAFGVVVWELYSGKVPFDGVMEYDIRTRVSSGELILENPGVGDFGRRMGSGLWGLAQLCLGRTPSSRPNAAELSKQLKALQDPVV
ncbi:hypothetical protein JAAARDRAFT_505545 [Jaapia argillacea MUCL 33604]|uniref:Protein kinase domain-containing protein n=1 Tax=Jaapia argillacea MUCL 33604 TaxID=933084 RepID=A0A067PA10_9AGAM|nr:hypothetical protein JAAARDRAFT_505545 [Jaapia argillacea MUCL 33604]